MKLFPSSETSRRATLVLVSIMFLVTWTALLVRLGRYWERIPAEAHYWAVMFALLYPWPWLVLVRKNGTKVQMAALAYLAFFVAMKFVFP